MRNPSRLGSRLQVRRSAQRDSVPFSEADSWTAWQISQSVLCSMSSACSSASDICPRLSAASGLETTQAALALRVVLGKMSRLSRPPFILLDEVLGTVAKENYDDMKKLYDKIVEYYDFVLHICHIDLDWYDGNIVTVVKNNNISSIKE